MKDVLKRLTDAISATQTALLGGNLHALENGLWQQIALCEKLRSLVHKLRDSGTCQHHAEILTPAKAALDRARVLEAVLRRMRQTLTAMQAAMRRAPLTYGPPSGRSR